MTSSIPLLLGLSFALTQLPSISPLRAAPLAGSAVADSTTAVEPRVEAFSVPGSSLHRVRATIAIDAPIDRVRSVVFASFALARVVVIQAMGVGMALAVTIETTLVRVLLVPSTMRLLGHLNWWAPRMGGWRKPPPEIRYGSPWSVRASRENDRG